MRAKLNLGLPIADCHGKNHIQQEGSFHQHIGLKFKEQSSRLLHVECSFVWR